MRDQFYPTPSPSHRGFALVSALLLAALAMTFVVLVSMQAGFRLSTTENQIALSQAQSSARAVIDFGRAGLLEDQQMDKQKSNPVDSLTEVWAQALPTLPVENGTVEGGITDAQGFINLNNLGLGGSHADFELIKNLFIKLQIDPNLANSLKDWVDKDDDVTLPGGAEDIDYLAMNPAQRSANRPLVDVNELIRVRGFSSEIVNKLRPFVSALPIHTPININTAPAPVLGILFQLSDEEANQFILVRAERPFVSNNDLLERAPSEVSEHILNPRSSDPSSVPKFQIDWSITSNFFQIDARASYGKVHYGLSALTQRNPNFSLPAILWERRTLF
jgi:general secretion pathway protein K